MPLTPMPSPKAIAAPPSTAHFQLSTVDSRLFCSKPFRFTHFRKNASANPLVSHTFKTKDLKCPVFTHFQKSGRGRGVYLGPVRGGADHRRFRLFWTFDSQLSTIDCQFADRSIIGIRPDPCR